MNTATKTAIDVLTPVIARAAQKAAERSPGVDYGDVHRITNDVTKEVAAVVVNQANAEPWYQSRVTWGAIVSMLIPLLGVLGVATDRVNPDEAIAFGMALGSVIGGAITLYGRWKAKKPIGQ